jgi:aconitase B
MQFIDTIGEDLYRYLNFDQMADYKPPQTGMPELL